MLNNIDWLLSGIITGVVVLFLEKYFNYRLDRVNYRKLCLMVAVELCINYKVIHHIQEDYLPLQTEYWREAFGVLSEQLPIELLSDLVLAYHRINLFKIDKTFNLNRNEIADQIYRCEQKLEKISNLKVPLMTLY